MDQSMIIPNNENNRQQCQVNPSDFKNSLLKGTNKQKLFKFIQVQYQETKSNYFPQPSNRLTLTKQPTLSDPLRLGTAQALLINRVGSQLGVSQEELGTQGSSVDQRAIPDQRIDNLLINHNSHYKINCVFIAIVNISIPSQIALSTMVMSWLTSLGELVSPNSRVQSIEQLKFRYLGFYFTASWCSSCIQGIRHLQNIMNKIQQTNPGDFKIITIRLDDKRSNLGYGFWRFPSLTVQSAQLFSNWFNIRLLPSLIILNNKWKIVSHQGYEELTKYQENVTRYWDSLQHNQ